jgi:hypothetical protein
MFIPSFLFQVPPLINKQAPLWNFPAKHAGKIQDLFFFTRQANHINFYKYFLFGLFLLVFNSSLGAEDLESYLPKDTLYYASCDLEAFRKHGTDLAFVQFTQDPEVEAFGRHAWEVSKKTLMKDKDGTKMLTFLEK